ncbi:MAG: hypothetical protein AMJ88_10355 [Anaerolineae bacterium SM23_ 63]|nr:MAG: hypothetical protein AMJ88_10355 [Anaerolineae bacterium SM23_ 63]HEY47132.1 DUF92 domain-containing protein [Anaerolineae bacterium]
MRVEQIVLGLVLGIGVSTLAYLTGHLTISGALMATLVGGLTFGFGGLIPAVLLILFFLSSSVLSRLGAERKQALAATFAKGGRRDTGQVLANGGIPVILAVLYGLTGGSLWLVGLVGALAASTADTWATEIGVLARRQPYLISTGKRVEPGTSGAVTPEGTLAAFGGAGVIGSVAWLLHGTATLVVLAFVGGFVGALFDSLLGATVQAIYHCPTCGKETERHPHHTCGSETHILRGWPWLNNDAVNFASSVIGGTVAMVGWSIL